MKKFWKWMEYKGYGVSPWLSCANSIEPPTHQMLVGYMDEYLHENGMAVGWPTYSNRKATIEDYYKAKEEMINSLELLK